MVAPMETVSSAVVLIAAVQLVVSTRAELQAAAVLTSASQPDGETGLLHGSNGPHRTRPASGGDVDSVVGGCLFEFISRALIAANQLSDVAATEAVSSRFPHRMKAASSCAVV